MNKMTKLKTISDSSLSITCAVCQHDAVLEVANLLLVVDEDDTAHDVRRRYSCPKWRVSDLLCMSNSVHASSTKEHEDNDDYEGSIRRAAERR